jgi:hypothetical protein
VDDEEVAIPYRERGLEAFVLTNHVVSTADRAWFARKHVAGCSEASSSTPRWAVSIPMQ